MDWLLIGGTRFSGRALSERLLAAGHRLTLLHRGSATGQDPFPEAEHLRANRREDLSPLRGRRFDAVVDFCGFFPRDVRASAELLRDSGWYGFVSSISAYPEKLRPGATEDDPVQAPPDPEPEAMDAGAYGPLKVGCERVVTEVFGLRAAIVRPGFIVGPNDPTDRFPSLLRGAAAGGTRLLPGPADAPLQFVDARDLAAFLQRLGEGGVGGTFLGVHPPRTTTIGEVVGLARDAAGADTRFVFADGDWLAARCTEEELEDAFPLWARDDPGFHLLDPVRATAAGLRHRPVAETVRDTLAWDAATAREVPRHGLSPEREAALLG